MVNRVVLAALAAAIFLGVGAYTFQALDDKGLRLAEVRRDACFARYGVNISGTAFLSDSVRIACNRPLRDYNAGRIWRFIFAVGVAATGAFLVVGGIDILIRRSRSGP
jgi:hypothetical protein